ncbi:MAG: hypothetical protein QGF46_03735, partial [Planctomycetota bacterium]|nr:hypothetical protein [Planctomycetota bacterium]
MRRILPTVILATVFFACASTPNYEQFSSEDVPQLQSEAESHYGNYQHLDAIDGYLKLTGIALQQLRDPDNLEDKQRLRAELEHYGLRLYIIAGSIDNHRDILKKLDKFHLSSSDGGIYEIYCNFNSDNRANLFYLHDFEFVGPFDNERGGGFDTALAAELDGDSSQIYSGKERDVKWRTTPQHAPRNGELDMGTLIYPHNQSALLMRSWVYNEEQRDAHMVIALEGEIKAWVNGEAVLEARGRHQFSLRNFSKKVSLRKGWNQIC